MDVLIKAFILTALILTLTFTLVDSTVLRTIVLILTGIIVLFVLNFFRDPVRTPPVGDDIVVSPADGRVVLIKRYFDSEYLNADAVQVSVFMSPLNVHVNRFPISGTVDYFKHIPGEYLVAFEEKSSERNERTHIGVSNPRYKLMFKQIAGTIARRIVAPIEVGQPAVLGQKFGMIKFGSRVDIIMPASSVVQVKLDDRVVAGETVVAKYH